MSKSPVAPVGTQLTKLADAEPDRPAVTCEGETISRGELASSTNQLAREYSELGVTQGSYVTICLPNSIEWMQAAIAAWKLGAVVQPLSARLPATEFGQLLDLLPRALLVGREDPRGRIRSVPQGFRARAEVSAAALPEAVPPAVKAMPSGGSTGRPKLIESTDGGRFDARRTASLFSMDSDDIQLVTGPLTHNTGFALSLAGLLLGQHVLLMPRFDAEQCLRLIAEYGVQWMATVPTVLSRLLAAYEEASRAYDLSSMRRLWHMGAPCPARLKERWIEILGAEVVWELYGGTETQAMTFISGSEWLSHRGSVGRVATGEMKVLDEEGRECPAGTVGEIFMRPKLGHGPTYRYIGSVAETRDGWDTIGDLGCFDHDGYLYLSDRRVDMFNVGARKVYPAEIEGALLAHPEVLSCLVVGVPDDDLGQVPYALVEPVQLGGLSAELVQGFLETRVASYKVPRYVEFTSEPLRDEAGKARRSAVRDSVVQRMAADLIREER